MKTLILIFVLLVTTCLYSIIINVPGDQPTIQAGINVAVDSDTVLVQPGTYVENINYNGKDITIASLFLTTQDTTYISQTVIDGNQNGNVVIIGSGVGSTAVLSGFTITNGYAYSGGGICCGGTSLSIMNVTISGNSASYAGGGIYCTGTSPSLQNVTITDNSTGVVGGGIFCYNSNLSLENVTISDNSGTGIFCDNSSPSLENVAISHNSGGGIYCYESSPSLQNVKILLNPTDWDGGGIYCSNSSPNLVNVTISGNSAGDGGGGIYCYYNSNPSLVNCILWYDSLQEIYFSSGGDPNSITISYSDIQGGEAGIVTNNNGIVNWMGGNIYEAPLFVGTGEHPYSFLEDSPCIDAGDPDTLGLNLPPWDIIGNHRIWDGDGNGSAIIDMGAYEYDAPPFVDIDDNVISHAPEVFLQQNYPNPFNPTTTISFSVTQTSSFVTLDIYNIKGQKVKQLVSDQLSAGQHIAIWKGRDSAGKLVSSGIYLYRLKTKNFEKTKKMILMK